MCEDRMSGTLAVPWNQQGTANTIIETLALTSALKTVHFRLTLRLSQNPYYLRNLLLAAQNHPADRLLSSTTTEPTGRILDVCELRKVCVSVVEVRWVVLT